jgi:hypothetical protein
MKMKHGGKKGVFVQPALLAGVIGGKRALKYESFVAKSQKSN